MSAYTLCWSSHNSICFLKDVLECVFCLLCVSPGETPSLGDGHYEEGLRADRGSFCACPWGNHILLWWKLLLTVLWNSPSATEQLVGTKGNTGSVLDFFLFLFFFSLLLVSAFLAIVWWFIALVKAVGILIVSFCSLPAMLLWTGCLQAL